MITKQPNLQSLTDKASTLETLTEYEQIKLTFENIRFGWVGIFVLAGFTMYPMQGYLFMPVWWMLATAGIALCHGLLVARFLHLDKHNPVKEPLTWGYIMAFISLIAGGLASIGVCLLIDFEHMQWSYFLIALLIMPGFGSAVTSASFQAIHIAWVLGSQLPLATYLTTSSEPVVSLMGIAVFFAGIPMMILFGFGYSKIYKRNIALNVKNQHLLQALQQSIKNEKKANQDKSRFLAAASHDLRQPHQALGLFLEALDHLESDAEKKSIIHKTKLAFKAMSSLLNQLLDISKLDSGTMQIKMTGIALQPFLHQIVMEYMKQAEQAGLELRLRPTNAIVFADPAMLQRIVSNLLSNAIRYTSHGGVLLCVRHSGSNWKLMVYDTGKGIHESEQNTIFQEFVQLNNPERDREKGLGLGLAIVKRLAHLMNTDIFLRSIPDRGSCFSIVLKAASQLENHLPIDRVSSLAFNAHSLKLIVVDDDQIARDGLVTLLKAWKIQVQSFCSSKECITALKASAWTPDALIIDYRLRGEETGIDAAQHIFKACGLKVPVLIMTGDTSPERIKDATKSGFPLLHKPVPAEKLKKFLSRIYQSTQPKPL